jgi:hypothetical protein
MNYEVRGCLNDWVNLKWTCGSEKKKKYMKNIYEGTS